MTLLGGRLSPMPVLGSPGEMLGGIGVLLGVSGKVCFDEIKTVLPGCGKGWPVDSPGCWAAAFSPFGEGEVREGVVTLWVFREGGLSFQGSVGYLRGIMK